MIINQLTCGILKKDAKARAISRRVRGRHTRIKIEQTLRIKSTTNKQIKGLSDLDLEFDELLEEHRIVQHSQQRDDPLLIIINNFYCNIFA
jgi:hypothetical protein